MPLTITHAKSNTIADFTGTVTIYNSAGATTTALATDLIRPSDWNSAHQITLSLTGSEVASLFYASNAITSSTNNSGISFGLREHDFFEPYILPNTNSTLSAPGIGTWYLEGPFQVLNPIRSGQFYLPVSNAAAFSNTIFSAASTGSATKYHTLVNNIALYKRGNGDSSSRLESYWSNSISFLATQEVRVTATTTNALTVSHYLTVSLPSQYDTSGGVTYGSTSGSGTASLNSSTAPATIASAAISVPMRWVTGARMDIIPFNSSIEPGLYWFAHMFTSSTSVTGSTYTQFTVFSTHSRLGLLENNLNAYKRLGSSTTNSTTNIQIPFKGFLATTTSAASSIIDLTNIRSTTGRAYFNIYQNSW